MVQEKETSDTQNPIKKAKQGESKRVDVWSSSSSRTKINVHLGRSRMRLSRGGRARLILGPVIPIGRVEGGSRA